MINILEPNHWRRLEQSFPKPSKRWRERTYKQVRNHALETPHFDWEQTWAVQDVTRPAWRYALIASLSLLLIVLPVQAVQAQQARPGQWLYPIKRLVESSQLLMTANPSEKNRLKQQFALNRVHELEQSIILKDSPADQDQAALQSKVSLTDLVTTPQDEKMTLTLAYVRSKLDTIRSYSDSKELNDLISEMQKVLTDANVPADQPSCASPQPITQVLGNATQATASATPKPIVCPSPPPTPSPTPTPNPTAAPTPTPLTVIFVTPQPSPSPTVSPSPTATGTPVVSPSPTGSPTPTPTPSLTMTIASMSGTMIKPLLDTLLP